MFRGIRGEQITVEDVRYADARNRFDKIALMYRRLLVLLWGLHDRTSVFGPLAVDAQFGGHANLLAADVQAALFNFIYDDESEMLLGEDRPRFREWIRQKNAQVQSGSRVIIRWGEVMTIDTAPSCFSGSYGYEEQRYHPESEWGIVTLSRKGKDLVAKISVSGYSESTHSVRVFLATVTLKKAEQFGYNAMLCMDDVVPEELLYYIESRTDREDYLQYIPLFMDAYRQAVADEEEAADLRARVLNSLSQGGVADVTRKGALDIVNSAIRQYRVAHRWSPVPTKEAGAYKKHLEKILGQLWIIFGKGGNRLEAVEAMVIDEGRQPLRLVVTGRNHLVLYAAPLDCELETRLGEHIWVQRIRIREGKTKVDIVNRRWTELPMSSPDETVLHVGRRKKSGPVKAPDSIISDTTKSKSYLRGLLKISIRSKQSAWLFLMKMNLKMYWRISTTRH